MSTASPHAIDVEDLRVVYKVGFLMRPKVALAGATFSVRQREIFGYVGANGAGKTTTIKTLVGLQRPSSGRATIAGIPVAHASSRTRLGFLPENPYFYEYLTAREALGFYGDLCGVPRATLVPRIAELLAQVHLEHAADRPIRGYSKGMRQRLGLAQALVNDPEVVILDEPMSGLDPLGRAQVRELILQMRERGRTVFFSSHILSDVEVLCDRICLVHQGVIRATGTIAELVGDQVTAVEVSASGLAPALVASLAGAALTHRELDGTHVFRFTDEAAANQAARAVCAAGGTLHEFTAHRRSLEDIYLDTTGVAAQPAAEVVS